MFSKILIANRSEEHTSELQSLTNLVCRLLLEKKKKDIRIIRHLGTSLGPWIHMPAYCDSLPCCKYTHMSTTRRCKLAQYASHHTDYSHTDAVCVALRRPARCRPSRHVSGISPIYSYLTPAGASTPSTRPTTTNVPTLSPNHFPHQTSSFFFFFNNPPPPQIPPFSPPRPSPD